MKTTSYTDDPIDPQSRETIRRLLAFEDTNFLSQVKLCGLDPAKDFQNLDLGDVDFSYCDLRGFNFSGSDLRGTYGVNVRWEIDDPILDGADTSDSLFSHRLAQERYFRDHPEESEVVDRLSTDYWANVIIRIEELLQDKASDRGAKIARALFDKSRDPSVRMNILLFMKVTTQQSGDHKRFISDILSRYSNDTRVALACLRALNVFYANDRDAFNWLVRFLTHPDRELRRTAFKGVVRSTRFMEGINQVISYVKMHADSEERRAFVGAAAGAISSRVQSAVYNWRSRCFYDFEETLTPITVIAWNDAEFRVFQAGHSKNVGSIWKAFLKRRLNYIGKFGERYGFFFKYQEKANAPVVELGRVTDLPAITEAQLLQPQSS